MTVRDIETSMSVREFTEWQAFARLSPLGGARGDIQAAVIASTVANVHRGKREPFRVGDFIPDFAGERVKPRQSIEEQIAIAKTIHNMALILNRRRVEAAERQAAPKRVIRIGPAREVSNGNR
jgi:Protein of unknown function (DUF4035)